jgi:SAM-dependent methyltransferase
MTFTNPKIQYRSQPAEVSMGDDWYDLANLDHFWIKHRFNIFDRLCPAYVKDKPNPKVADIGCGHGLLQCQLEKRFGWHVEGFDLNIQALRNSVARNHSVSFYDINECHADLKCLYDFIFLFDVIEHLPDERQFLQSVKFHLNQSGLLVINVPAFQWLYSRYDSAAGHYRRYTWRMLSQLLQRQGFTPISYSYWGVTNIPLIMARKIMLALRPLMSDSDIITAGFKSPSVLANQLLNSLSYIDPIPNRFVGSSLMAVFAVDPNCD